MRLPLSLRLAGAVAGPSPVRRGSKLGRDAGLAARSLCIPLSAMDRGGMLESLGRASRATQSGLRAHQKGLEAADTDWRAAAVDLDTFPILMTELLTDVPAVKC